MNFVPTDKATLQSKVKENIFAIGDATNLPASKAGSVAHFEAEILLENILRFIEEYRASCIGNASKLVGDHALMASL